MGSKLSVVDKEYNLYPVLVPTANEVVSWLKLAKTSSLFSSILGGGG